MTFIPHVLLIFFGSVLLLKKRKIGGLHGGWDIDLAYSESNDENSIKPCFFLPPSFQNIDHDVCIVFFKKVNANKDTETNHFFFCFLCWVRSQRSLFV